MSICFDLCDFNLTFVYLKARSTLLIVLALYLFNTLGCYAVCILFSYMPFILVVQSLVHIVQLKSNSFVITVLEITHNLSLLEYIEPICIKAHLEAHVLELYIPTHLGLE